MDNPIERRQALHLRARESEARIRLLEAQIQATQKLATIGTTTCLAAHEFNNLLMVMINWAQQALQRQDDVEFMRRALHKTVEHCNHAARIVESMMSLVRASAEQRQNVDIAELVQNCLQALGRDLQKDSISVRLDLEPGLHLHIAPGQLQQVLVNLIVNARQAMLDTGGGTLTIAARLRDHDSIRIQVTDTGPGMTAAVRERVFEPFFTTRTDPTRPENQGTGLGLAICRDLVESEGGSITVDSEPGRGAAFTINLPRLTPQDPTPAPREPSFQDPEN